VARSAGLAPGSQPPWRLPTPSIQSDVLRCRAAPHRLPLLPPPSCKRRCSEDYRVQRQGSLPLVSFMTPRRGKRAPTEATLRLDMADSVLVATPRGGLCSARSREKKMSVGAYSGQYVCVGIVSCRGPVMDCMNTYRWEFYSGLRCS
jgi:hypothetical protein